MKLYDLETWEDVEALIRGLLSPKSLLNEVMVFGWTPEEIAWYERVEAMRVSLDNTPEARYSHTDGHGRAKT